MLDWSIADYGPFDRKNVTVEELLDILGQRKGIETPYLLTIVNDEVKWFDERYVKNEE